MDHVPVDNWNVGGAPFLLYLPLPSPPTQRVNKGDLHFWRAVKESCTLPGGVEDWRVYELEGSLLVV